MPQVPIPPKSLISDFTNIIKPIWSKFENNIQEIQTLIRLRDTLLPKLMSGKLRVPSE